MKRAIVLLALVVLPVMLLAQTAGKLTGVVTSTDGTALAGANIVLEGTSMGAATDEDGRYYILNVPVGHYSVRADYIGYRSSIVNDVRVSVGLTTTRDFALEVAAVEGEEVIVTAEKPLLFWTQQQQLKLLTLKQFNRFRLEMLAKWLHCKLVLLEIMLGAVEAVIMPTMLMVS